MITVEFEPEGFKELRRRLDAATETARISVNDGLRAIGHIMVPTLKAHTPRGATGHLRTKTRFEVLTIGAEQELQVRQGAQTVGGAFYGRFVRGGRRPGRRPPIDALVPWVSKVLGVPAARVRSVAFLVARKIGKKGIAPNPYHERALAEATPQIQQQVTAMGTRVTAFLAGR